MTSLPQQKQLKNPVQKDLGEFLFSHEEDTDEYLHQDDIEAR